MVKLCFPSSVSFALYVFHELPFNQFEGLELNFPSVTVIGLSTRTDVIFSVLPFVSAVGVNVYFAESFIS